MAQCLPAAQSASTWQVATGRQKPNAQSSVPEQSEFCVHDWPTPLQAPRSNGQPDPPDGSLGTQTPARHWSPLAQSASWSHRVTPPSSS